METVLIILVAIAVAANIILGITLFKRKSSESPKQDGEGLRLILQQVNELSRTVDKKLGENTKEMADALHRQFGESQRLIKDITNEITQVKDIGKQSLSVQAQLRDLQDMLKNPKQRGILGEYYLETLLKNILAPGQYQMQYAFQNGEVVDAVIRIKDKIIPVDSKFSLENYNKLSEEKNQAERDKLEKAFVGDLKIRIQETSKYIRPAENTLDFAFMFIPHEAIYYDLLINKIGSNSDETDNLIQRAASRYKVIIVSPTSFLAYLTTVLQGLKAMQIEETAKDIIKHVGQLGAHLTRYEEYQSKLGVSLATTVNHYNASYKELKKVDKDVTKIAGVSPGIEPVLIDKPETE